MATWSSFLKKPLEPLQPLFFLFLQVADFGHNKNTKYYHDKFNTKLYYLVNSSGRILDLGERRETVCWTMAELIEWKKTIAMIQKYPEKESKFLDKTR